ncbi:DUF2515 family protein [Alicyclobacillus fastidiosus]|uniref:DUF2515 family protein n=1 Tax=Alicyclobacillus fastidiosus TaxID=392011 RepID=A0ABV5ABL2_9BACL
MLQSLMNRAKLIWLMTAGRDRKKVLHLVSALTKSAKGETSVSMSADERAVVEEIVETTHDHNRNNLTRTAAYLRFYRRWPEVHWAFLAHMVSRNGGFSMTDVKGEWFTRVATGAQRDHFFAFLERANWLIFGDAYPQLLLYEKCETLGRDLTHLLPAFGVSRFMPPIWKAFLQTKDSSLLTHALIINEQNFIESRIIASPNYDDEVIFTLEFQMQAVLGLNQVLFPYRDTTTSACRLAGATVSQFASLQARIGTGKRLYSILFRDPSIHAAILDFAARTEHTGSRRDYWPDVFTDEPPGGALAEHYSPCFLQAPRPGRQIYSPRLRDAWADVEHPAAERGDWFVDMSSIVHLFTPDTALPVDFTSEYTDAGKTVEHIILAKEKLASLAKPFV